MWNASSIKRVVPPKAYMRHTEKSAINGRCADHREGRWSSTDNPVLASELNNEMDINPQSGGWDPDPDWNEARRVAAILGGEIIGNPGLDTRGPSLLARGALT